MVLTASSDRSTSTPVNLVPLDRRDEHVIAVSAPPAPLTSFIGRERELARLGALLRRGDVRLVTLTGPGGIGKTRLALRVADDLRGDPSPSSGQAPAVGSGQVFPDGIAFVELAAIRNPDLVLETVAQTLGLRQAGGHAGERLVSALRSRRVLIVLDNVEQVLGAAPAIAVLLTACPHLTILATSRAPLRISGEHDVQVPVLALPAGDDVTSDAVQLFSARAHAAQSGFSLDTRTAPVVADICRRLDGLPLAIELAAARTRHLTLPSLLLRLDRRLPLLTGGARNQPARLQTMRDAIAWDYELLSPDEQSLFRRLGVFSGGFSLDAAEAVGRRESGVGSNNDVLSPDSRLPSPVSVLDGLSALVDQSLLYLVAVSEDEAESPRFGMLETIREYALERLAAADETTDAQAARAAWCLAFAECAAAALAGAAEERWLARVEREHPNLRAALSWLAVHGPHEEALRLAAALSRFWEVRGHWSEGRRWLEGLLATVGEQPDLAASRARALTGAGRLALQLGDDARSAECHEQSLALYRMLDDRQGIAFALANIGFLAYRRDNTRRAETFFEESLALYRSLSDQRGIAFVLDSLGVTANLRGDQPRAADLFRESLTHSRNAGDQWQIAVTLVNLGIVTTHQADFAGATRFFEESVPLAESMGDERLTAIALSYLGLIAQEQGETNRAVALFKDSLARCRNREGHAPGPRCLAGLAAVAARQGTLEQAARLFAATEAMHIASRSAMWPAERAINDRRVAAVRAGMSEAAFSAAWNAGQALRLDEVVATALTVAADVPPDQQNAAASPVANDSGLTPRECDVLRLLATGRSNPEIADALFIGRGTVRTHVSNILGKLGVARRTEATHVAFQRGLI